MNLTAVQREQFETQGYFTTDVVFDADTLAQVRAEFDRLWQEEIASAEASGDRGKVDFARLRPFIAELHKRSEICTRFAQHEVFQECCRQLVGPDADLYYNQAVIKPPGKGRSFAWHQDNQYGLVDPAPYITCWCAVSRATVDNGTIWVAPGLHNKGLLPHIWDETARDWHCQFDDSYKIPVVLRPGQMAVFSSLLPHCSGANVSKETRYAAVLQYHVSHVVKQGTSEPAGDKVPIIRNGKSV